MHDEAIDVLILGNSRAYFTYNDTLMSELLNKKCVNLGWSGYPFDYEYHVIWKTFIKQNPAPKQILLEVGPWAFFDYVNPKYTIEMLPYIERPEFQFYVNLCPELSCRDHILLYKYAGKGRQMINEYKMFYSKTLVGRGPRKKWNPNYVQGPIALEHDSLILRDFEAFIQECDSLHIPLIFVDSPMHMEDGYSCFEMDKFWELIYSYIGDRPIEVLNYESLYGNDTTLFQDPMHLTDATKNLFTTKIAHDLDSLHLLQPLNR